MQGECGREGAQRGAKEGRTPSKKNRPQGANTNRAKQGVTPGTKDEHGGVEDLGNGAFLEGEDVEGDPLKLTNEGEDGDTVGVIGEDGPIGGQTKGGDHACAKKELGGGSNPRVTI